MSLGEYLGAGSGITKGLYHLNGNSTDVSGNGNNGTDTNITYVAGKFGNCASFNGSSSKIVLPTMSLTQQQAKTHSMWYNTDSINNNATLLNLVTAVGKYFILVHRSETSTLRMQYATSGAATQVGSFASVIGTWYNLVYVNDGSNNHKVYINGQLVMNENITLSTGNLIYHTLGAGGDTGSYGSFYDGLFDEVIVENVPRDASKVKKYYTYAKGRFGIL